MRAVVDANVFVSAFINVVGAPALVIDAWLARRFVVVMSEALRAEIREVSSRPTTARYFRATGEPVAIILSNLDAAVDLVIPDPVSVVQDDPDDDIVLGTATAGDADYIVSGDKHLLALGSFAGIPIVTPAHFLRILGDEP